MMDVVEELHHSYASRTPGACDVEALILGATTNGDGLRRVRRRRRSGALALTVVVAVAATSIAISSRSDNRLRVTTTEPATTTTAVPVSSVPIATDHEFPGLDRLLKYVLGEVDRDAEKRGAVRAEVVLATAAAFDGISQRPSTIADPANLVVYLVQLTGTTFVCRDCFSLSTAPRGAAMRIAWDPRAHGVAGREIGKPIDLAKFGRVYRIELRHPRAPSTASVCTQADLDRPGLAMPTPRSITAPMGLEQFSRLDPAPGAHPAISAATAWATLTRNQPVEARSGELLLGYYASFEGGLQAHVLVWVVHLGHLAFTGSSGGGVPRPGTPTTARPVCIFTTAYLVLNATTGTGIVDAYGG